MAPNAANVVPGHVRLLVDARAERRPDMEAFATWLDQAAKNVAREHGVSDLSTGARLGQRASRLRSSTSRSSGRSGQGDRA